MADPLSSIPRYGPSPAADDDESVSLYEFRRNNSRTFRRVQRVSRNAALATKQQLWDSNDASIHAALSAVDQWEAAYNALRLLMVTSANSAKGLYGAAKEGAGKLEHGLLMPVRDWILLPAFCGLERAVAETAGFLQSDQARNLAKESLELTKRVPFLGENLLAPAMCFTVQFWQRTWEIAQYPIPSKQQVRDTVDYALTGTKWALTTAGREVYLYIKRADANITRTLSHTRWKVLGSGPYATLDKLNKREVIDHLCERYFALSDPLARYELAAHIRLHNRPLFHDLVLTGLLKERGSELTKDDEWLSTLPSYRTLEDVFLIHKDMSSEVSPLWFRLPLVNGKRPSRDNPWICFRRKEQHDLEYRYLQILENGQGKLQELESKTSQHPTIAKWYSPTPADVFVDQRRHAVSFFLCCPKCREPHTYTIPPLVQKEFGDLCDSCASDNKMPSVAALLSPPPLTMVMRPTFWRFHGPGDVVRRATWFLETRSGLQPFDEEATAILEDSYLFLKWMSLRQAFEDRGMDDALLTVEVPCPDGTVRLVQFSSLSRATAIQKGIGAALALFKRRVYRGAWLHDKSLEQDAQERLASVEETVARAVEINGALGETSIPDVSIRSLLTPSRTPVAETRLVPYEYASSSLAVFPVQLDEQMGRFLDDENISEKIDHLILIVHGIGEMLRSIDVFGLSLPNLSSIVDCCAYLRKNHAEVQEAHFSHMYPTADATLRASTGRIEYLPVEWHEAFSILSQRARPLGENVSDIIHSNMPSVMLKDISLRTIPNMRDFANDTLMDVLYFMSPEHHDIIIDIVVQEMNVVVDKFRRLTGFTGRISVAGHSLGSIISWDILCNQNASSVVAPRVSSMESLDTVSGFYSPTTERSYVYGYPPELTQTQSNRYAAVPPPLISSYPQLDFSVDNFFMLGSPVAVFLMIRNQRKPLSEEFYLRGCRRVFNIFHPYDPVAYRIEPCINPRNADFEPSIMKHWNGGFRVQYQTKRLWRKLVDTTWRTQQNFVEAFEASMAGMGLTDSAVETHDDDDTTASEMSSDDSRLSRVATGLLNRGRRIDFMLQEKEIENANEYVAALAAHSSYWIEKDLSLFIARQIYLSTLEHAAEVEGSTHAWEPIQQTDSW